ncbi:9109_t:CDS:2, partial [Funneliformis geosporum]
MESKIDLLRQKNDRLVVKNYELKAEIAKLRQIIEENARHNTRVEELEQKNKEHENDKEMIAEVLPEIVISDVNLSNAVVDQQNNEDLFMTSIEPITLPEQTSVGTSPVKSSMVNKQVLTSESYENADTV